MRRKLTDNLKRVHDQIAAACERGGRQPEDVRLVAVTKTVEVDVIRAMLEAGVAHLGESRVQELVKRAGMIQESLSRRRQLNPEAPLPVPTWHMIGHLQRNKVRQVLPWVEEIHSVDSLRLAEEISKESERLERITKIYIEVNVAGEKSKYGVAVGALNYLMSHIVTMPGLKIVGLMTMAPLVDDPEAARPHFRRLRELLEDLRLELGLGPEFCGLSMGMSNDFEVAVEEGATIVRVGSALFEGIANAASGTVTGG